MARNNADLFGLAREKKVVQSRVRDIFTPHQPISDVDLLYGRQDEVRRILEHINTPGQHALLYGERGVGKSSLANVLTSLFVDVMMRGRTFVKRCDSGDTFETIMLGPLKDVGAKLPASETIKERKKGFAARVPGTPASLDASRRVQEIYRRGSELSPSVAAEALTDTAALLLVDEADAIGHSADRRRLAELIKHLSDAGSPFKVLVVGIADTGEELTAAHPSVQRCLKETKLRRMSDEELREIIVGGAEKLNIKFSHKAQAAIVSLSSGYPHFTHLLALKCAEEAIAEGVGVVEVSDVRRAMDLAVEDAEGSLKRAYDTAARSYATDMYSVILQAAASLDKVEFAAGELRSAIARITGAPISQNSLNNYFQKLVSTDGSTIIRRVAKGMYRFEDPRMSSYVKIANGLLDI